MKRLISLMLAALFSASCSVCAFAKEALTKAEYADIVLEGAKDYNPGITMDDIVKNADGEKQITKAEALVILKRAFGRLPALEGDFLRTAPEPAAYMDLPVWSQSDISDLSKAGVLSEEGALIGASDSVDREYTDAMLARMYRLFASNPRDDFYYSVNREYLKSSRIARGMAESSVYSDINNEIGGDIAEILADIIKKEHKTDSMEQKIKDFYLSAADVKKRDKLGIEPIKPYIDRLNGVKTDSELEALALDIASETSVDYLIGFSVTEDINTKGKYLPVYQGYEATLPLEEYTKEGSKSLEGLRAYMTEVFTLAGDTAADAAKKADMIVEFEKGLAAHSKTNEELEDIKSAYNYYTPEQLNKLFQSVDINKIAEVHGFELGSKIVAADPEAMKYYAELFDGNHTELLKAMFEVSMLSFYGDILSSDFIEAKNMLTEAVYGFNPDDDILSDAFNTTASLMDEYLGRVYCERKFTDKDKARIEAIVKSIISAYTERIQGLDWLGDRTKAEACKKLSGMKIIIGMPENEFGFISNVKISDESYADNIYAVLKENDRIAADLLNGEMGIEDISFSAYMVNASYYPNFNTIVLPAGILRKPIYDPDASKEQNYGAIGYVIGHEISHAFDTSGAEFDEKGNYVNWWEKEDYNAFEALSKKAEEYYDGAEAAAGLRVNGRLTLDENIADIAGVEAALDALKAAEKNPDYKAFFESLAHISRCTASRQTMEFNITEDVHSPAGVRVNYAVKSTDEFYEAYGVKEGDGMYVPENERIRIW